MNSKQFLKGAFRLAPIIICSKVFYLMIESAPNYG